ncbi:16368_t:CDS:2 [Gigaspora margarita]|uniref:16368_t:CDS:1 n=1 Tax=Gigaspora margarita TaxID=4874 RepID=A0ABM8VZL0_GIGMA|nr:16368_t:CDS:2 [Gigaspora margarita]
MLLLLEASTCSVSFFGTFATNALTTFWMPFSAFIYIRVTSIQSSSVLFPQIQAITNDHHEVKAILEDIIHAHEVITVHIHEVITVHIYKVMLLINQDITLVQVTQEADLFDL